MANMIIEYVRKGGKGITRRYASLYVNGQPTGRKKQTTDKGGHRIGVMVAVVGADGDVHVGWSRCNKMDTFKQDRGLNIAIARAKAGVIRPIASSMARKMQKFVERVRRCYKDKNIHLSFSYPEKEAAAG